MIYYKEYDITSLINEIAYKIKYYTLIYHEDGRVKRKQTFRDDGRHQFFFDDPYNPEYITGITIKLNRQAKFHEDII